MIFNIKNLDRICFVVVLIIALGIGYWAVSWGLKHQKLVDQENELLSRKLKDLNMAETNLQRLKTILDVTKKELKILNQRIPDTAKVGEFLRQVDSLMKLRQINLLSLHPKPPVEEKNCNRISIRLVCKGSFVEIYRLLYDLENMNRTVVMEKMKISKTEKEKFCLVDLTANIFQRL